MVGDKSLQQSFETSGIRGTGNRRSVEKKYMSAENHLEERGGGEMVKLNDPGPTPIICETPS